MRRRLKKRLYFTVLVLGLLLLALPGFAVKGARRASLRPATSY